jgi:hypothetical protein
VNTKPKKQAVHRQQFPDGSAILTFPNGSMAILENEAANPDVLYEGGRVESQRATATKGSQTEKVAGY